MRKSLLVIPFGVVLITCLAPVGGGGGGGLLHDAGVFLIDAGRRMGGDARAQQEDPPPREVVEVTRISAACDQIATQTTEFVGEGNTYNNELRQFYADVDVPGLDPAGAPLLTVVGCERETFGRGLGGTCGDDFRCTNDTPEPLACATLGFAQVGEGRLRVFCGHRQMLRRGAPGEEEEEVSGERWNTIRVSLL